MKTLVVIRHAKAMKPEEVSLPDFDRPLAKRGQRDAREMGQRLAREGIVPDFAFSSPAVRALATARIVAEKMGLPSSAVATDADIYEAETHALLKALSKLDDRYECVLLIGHNPGLFDLVNALAGGGLDQLVPCGVAILQVHAPHWRLVAPGCALLLRHLEP